MKSMKIRINYKMPKDHNWHTPEDLELTRIPVVDEYIATDHLRGAKLCHVKLVIHTPTFPHVAEVFGDWVEREAVVNAVDNFQV
jgi:hypothetical protein